MTFYRLYYHLVWATKYRQELIDRELEDHLFPFLQNKSREIPCSILAINGWFDHIHLIVSIPPAVSVAQAVKRLKGSSSHDFEGLSWQRGYGALSVGSRHLPDAIGYVERQKHHHESQTTLAWLERWEEETEGARSASSNSVHEGLAVYEVNDWLF